MKNAALTIIVPMVILLSITMAADAVDSMEIRSQVAAGNFVWNSQNFAGFYYDIKDDIGTETLSTILTDNSLSGDSPYGVKYVTTAKSQEFEFEDWGAFKVMGFMADKYFAGYVENKDNAGKSLLFKESADGNSLSREQLQKILIDDDTEKTVTSGTPLKLEEGYELAIKSIDLDGTKVTLELSKEGSVVDRKVISPSKDGATTADRTYYYKNPAVGDQKNLITIAAHFKNAFRGADLNLATIDGLWQISGESTKVKADTRYDKMTITSTDAKAGTVIMENKDNAITLARNKDTVLMDGVMIKTADNETLRYYIFKEIAEPGTYEIRGAVATDDFAWNPQNFAGFFYDIKDDIGTETISTTLTDKELNGDSPYGVKYVTAAKSKEFEFEDWGAFRIMGFMADRYFAGYITNEDAAKNIFFKESTDENSLSNEQLEKILIDDDTEKTVTSGTLMKLEEGYELAIKSIDIDGNKVSLELSKDGYVVDSKVISPSKPDANMADKTYYYMNPAVGDQKNLVTIAAHFKNAFRGSDSNLATIDGLWQISGEATKVKVDTQYDKMTITSTDANAGTITMENKDNAITLARNKDTVLMDGVKIKTADNETLRYYIYKAVTIEGAATPANETEPVVEAAPAVEEKTAEAPAEEDAKREYAMGDGNSEMPRGTVMDDLDVKIENLPNGTIIMAVPGKMTLGEPKQFLIAISRTPNLTYSQSDRITKELDQRKDIMPEEIHSDVLKVYKFMKVILIPESSGDFTIEKQFSEDIQYVPINDFAVWKWMVTPNKNGEKAIRMRVSVKIEDTPSWEFDVYNKTYLIESNTAYSVQRFIADNGIVGAIITAIIGLGVWFAKRKMGGSKE